MTVAKSRSLWILAIIGAMAALVAALYPRTEPGTVEIPQSYAFDVQNMRYMAGYSENVFVGRVVEIAEISDPYTRYKIEVEETLKGSLSGSVVVSQLGYVDGGTSHIAEDQPLLIVGETYLLMTNPDVSGQGGETLIAGPVAAVLVAEHNRGNVISDYQRAIRNQQYPPGVPPKGD